MPVGKRKRLDHVLDTTGYALWGWLVGKVVAMVLVGVLVWAGLSIVGAPLPLALGAIAGFVDFVTFIGLLAAAVPGILLCLIISPT